MDADEEGDDEQKDEQSKKKQHGIDPGCWALRYALTVAQLCLPRLQLGPKGAGEGGEGGRVSTTVVVPPVLALSS